MKLRFALTDDADPSLLPPKRASAGAAGYDLCANLSAPIILKPSEIALVPTGLRLAMEPGVEAQIRPRSGLAIRNGITVVNAPGTIDWDYRGEIQVGLVNLGRQDFEITHAMRIAQLVFARVELPEFVEAELDESVRGEAGFGSTGLSGVK